MFGVFDALFQDFLGPNTFGPCGSDDRDDPSNYGEDEWIDQDWADYYGVDVDDLEDAMDDDCWD